MNAKDVLKKKIDFEIENIKEILDDINKNVQQCDNKDKLIKLFRWFDCLYGRIPFGYTHKWCLANCNDFNLRLKKLMKMVNVPEHQFTYTKEDEFIGKLPVGNKNSLVKEVNK